MLIGLDTNMLLRLVVRDHEEQHEKVTALLARDNNAEYFINNLTLSEFVWVMKKLYKFEKNKILLSLNIILKSPFFNFENPILLQDALEIYSREPGYDFPDILIGLVNQSYGCSATCTFDRKAAQLPYFELVT